MYIPMYLFKKHNDNLMIYRFSKYNENVSTNMH